MTAELTLCTMNSELADSLLLWIPEILSIDLVQDMKVMQSSF